MGPPVSNMTLDGVWKRVGDSLRASEKRANKKLGTIHEADLMALHTDEHSRKHNLPTILDRMIKLNGGLDLLEQFKKGATARKRKDAEVEVVNWLKLADTKVVKDARDAKVRDAAQGNTDTATPPAKRAKTDTPKPKDTKAKPQKKGHVNPALDKNGKSDDEDGSGPEPEAELDDYQLDERAPIVPGYKDESIAKRFGGIPSSPPPEPKLPKGVRYVAEDEIVIGIFKLDATPKRLVAAKFVKGPNWFTIIPISYSPHGDIVYPNDRDHNNAWCDVGADSDTSPLMIVDSADFDRIVQSYNEVTKGTMTFEETKDYVWRQGRDKGLYLDWGYVNPEDMNGDTAIRYRMNKMNAWLNDTRVNEDLYTKPEVLGHTSRSLALTADCMAEMARYHWNHEVEAIEAKRTTLNTALKKIVASNNSFEANVEVMKAANDLANTAYEAPLHMYKSMLVNRGNMPPVYESSMHFPNTWAVQSQKGYVRLSNEGGNSLTCAQLRKGPSFGVLGRLLDGTPIPIAHNDEDNDEEDNDEEDNDEEEHANPDGAKESEISTEEPTVRIEGSENRDEVEADASDGTIQRNDMQEQKHDESINEMDQNDGIGMFMTDELKDPPNPFFEV